MEWIWRFPLLPLPEIMARSEELTRTNIGITALLCIILVVAALIELYLNTRKGYAQYISRDAFLTLGAAVILEVVGIINLVLVAMACALLWYVVWRGFIYWFLWRMIAKNIWAAWPKKS